MMSLGGSYLLKIIMTGGGGGTVSPTGEHILYKVVHCICNLYRKSLTIYIP